MIRYRSIYKAALCALLTLGCARVAPATTKSPDAAAGASQLSGAELQAAAFSIPRGQQAIADVAEKVLPSVVNISFTKVAERVAPHPFRHFFGPGNARERERRGMGSGVIVSSDGTILTNNHVVENAASIKVTTHDQREFEATLVGTDPKSDLAVIKLKGEVKGLRPIELGNSSKLRLGEIVLAVGNPFGVGQTVTMGIVSATGRADVGIVDYEDFIQTDAAINPGNSGGALVDLRGQLVGINTAILSKSGGNMGIGFAIPTDMARPIMQSLKDHGRVIRGWLGVSIQNVEPELAQAMGLPSAHGVLVSGVLPTGPAAKSGLKLRDVILKVDGKGVDSTGELRNQIASSGAKKRVELELLRNKKRLVLAVELGEMPASDKDKASSPKSPKGFGGLGVSELTPTIRKKYAIADDVTYGVVIQRTQPSSPAARVGLRPGDVILEVGNQQVKSFGSFSNAFRKAGEKVALLILRKGRTFFIVLKK